MKKLFLTSEVNLVASDISKKIKTKSGNLRTAYIITPTEKNNEEDDLLWSKQNQTSMIKAGFDIFKYSITDKNLEKIRQDLNSADVIYVEGGSLVHMMNQTRLSGFDIFIREFIENDGVYIGTSTGSFITAEDTAPGLSLEEYLEDGFDTKGIGLINFLVMPHWSTDAFKDNYYKMPQYAYHMKVPMIILTDTQYVWVEGECVRIVDVTKDVTK